LPCIILSAAGPLVLSLRACLLHPRRHGLNLSLARGQRKLVRRRRRGWCVRLPQAVGADVHRHLHLPERSEKQRHGPGVQRLGAAAEKLSRGVKLFATGRNFRKRRNLTRIW